MQMHDIPAGKAHLGATDGEYDERPVQRLTLSAFRLSRMEVTNAEFAAFVAASGYVTHAERVGSGWVWRSGRWQRIKGANWRHPHGPESDIAQRREHPVVQVSWYDAQAYCQWLSKKENKT